VSDETGVSRRAIRRVEDQACRVETQAPTLKALGDFYGVQPSSLRLPAVYEVPEGMAA
jgi:hypothetical protein